MTKLTIYGGTNCTACENLKDKLTAENIQYTYHNVHEDMDALQVLVSNGLRGVPQVFDGDHRVGNSWGDVQTYLKEGL